MEKLIILTTIYNCEKYLARCLDSIIAQSYTNWVCYLLNDLSTDGSQKIAEDYVKEDSRFVLINNIKKYYQPGNYDQVLRKDDVDGESIVIEVDGDDYLATKDSLLKVYILHKQGYWITHGSFYYTDGRIGFSKPFDVSALRTTQSNATHLRSWRAKLWKNIDKEDLMYNGWYAPTAGDVFFMLPMLEMAGNDKIIHVDLPLYVYNEENPINDHKVDMGKQFQLADVGRKNKKYKMMKKKIGLLIIATNKYIKFLQQLITSADKYFLNDHDVTYFIFSNEAVELNTDRKIVLTKVEHREWPWMTLGRYEIFNNNSYKLKNMDYLYYCDVDMKFVSKVEDEIFSARVATQHPGYYGTRGTPDTNSKSLACIYSNENMQYFAGGFNGGSSYEYLKMSKQLSHNIKVDYSNNVIALWHDESHMNRYFIDNPPTKILSPSYCYAENYNIPFEKKLLALDKNHNSIRSI